MMMNKQRTAPQLLSAREITSRLKPLRGWRYLPKQKALSTERKLKDFMTCIRTIQKIAKLAEKADHHPDLHLTGYRHLKITLSTHEAGGVTEKDFILAGRINLSLP